MTHRAGAPSPGRFVAGECLRAAGAGLALPWRAADAWLRREALAEELEALLHEPASIAPDPPSMELNGRPLRVFVSCAEASGEIHAVSFVRELTRELARLGAPAPALMGLGGPRLAAEGVRILGDPVARAAMGADALRSLGFYAALLREVARSFERERPDLIVPIDSPALHVPLARAAHEHGIPVVHFVTPQYWAWAPWRVHAYREAVDLALTILPFEPAWFVRRGVAVAHVGHPLLDVLPPFQPRGAETSIPRHLVLCAGSRESVVRRNLPWMLATYRELAARLPGLTVEIAQDRAELRPMQSELVREAGLGAQVPIGEDGLRSALARAGAALSVSGTVLIDLLQADLPSVVIYRLDRALSVRLAPQLLCVPFFSSVNLLAGEGVYPEFLFAGRGPKDEIVGRLERLLCDGETRKDVRRSLARARERLGPPGASARAARQALACIERPLR